MPYLKDISLQTGSSPIEGETVKSVSWGDSIDNRRRPYTAISLTMQSGRVFVITSLLGEVCIQLVETC